MFNYKLSLKICLCNVIVKSLLKCYGKFLLKYIFTHFKMFQSKARNIYLVTILYFEFFFVLIIYFNFQRCILKFLFQRQLTSLTIVDAALITDSTAISYCIFAIFACQRRSCLFIEFGSVTRLLAQSFCGPLSGIYVHTYVMNYDSYEFKSACNFLSLFLVWSILYIKI